MESTMCLGENRLFYSCSSPPLFFSSSRKKRIAQNIREGSTKPNIGVLWRSLFVLPTSGRGCQTCIANRSTLEFSPHHPAMSWPSNSRLLWPEQINNKPGTFHGSSGENKWTEYVHTFDFYQHSQRRAFPKICFYFFTQPWRRFKLTSHPSEMKDLLMHPAEFPLWQ